MTNKLKKHIEQIEKNRANKFNVDMMKYYNQDHCDVFCDSHRLLIVSKYPHTIYDINVAGFIKYYLDLLSNGHLLEGFVTKEELKAGISKIAGRAYSVPVYYKKGNIEINARYLIKAMEGLDANNVYYSEEAKAFFLFQGDDVKDSTCCEIILGINVSNHEDGFYNPMIRLIH